MRTQELSITLHGSPGTSEYQAAEWLRDLIRSAVLPADNGTVAIAWRSSAVALGGLGAMIETARNELCSRGRADNPFQRTRFGQAVISHETGRLWLLEALQRVDSAAAEESVAYVNLARTAVEAACLDALRSVQRSLGLSAFMQGSRADRIARDLATYLRQPAPDEVLVEAAGYFIRGGVRTL